MSGDVRDDACAAPSTSGSQLHIGVPALGVIRGRAANAVGVGAAAAALATLATTVIWGRGLSIDAPTARASLESLVALCGAVVVGVLIARFTVTRELRDLLLIIATAVLTLASVVGSALPAALALDHGGRVAGTAPWGFLFASAGFWLAANTRSGRLAPARAHLTEQALSLSLAITLLATAFGAVLDGHLVRSTLGCASAALLLSAALLVWQRGSARQAGDAWLAAGVSMLGIAQLYGASVPRLAPGAVSPSEPACLAGTVLLLLAAAVYEREARVTSARLAVIAERQRVARDLHDGIAQDLAFIAAHAGTLPSVGDGEHPLGVAARRALALSRTAIDDLSDLDGRPLSEALAVLATELSDRFAITVRIDAVAGDGLGVDVRRDLVRIVREAVANAVKHGAASNVTVALDRGPGGTVLRVRDDGIGMRRADGDLGA